MWMTLHSTVHNFCHILVANLIVSFVPEFDYENYVPFADGLMPVVSLAIPSDEYAMDGYLT